jgi:hypothetical protein
MRVAPYSPPFGGTRQSASNAAAQFVLPTGASPLVGTTVVIDWWPEPCSCGSRLGVIGSSGGPHENRIVCVSCTRFRLSAWRAQLLLSGSST